MRLKINQQFAKIGLQIKPPQIKVRQTPGKFKLQQIPGKLKINSKPTKVKVDMTQARADLNYKTQSAYSRQLAKQGQQAALKSIAEYAKEGDKLAAIEKGGKPLIQQAKKNSQNKKRKVGLRWKRGADVKVKVGKQEIEFKKQDFDGVQLNSQPSWPKVDLDWGKVKVYQQQKPKLEIRAVDVRK
ncbi:hypothetical protein Halha_2274 [Halobacteroides halobius DSM 5150]|uniref:Uncharacterized protein n=1 Tax=Halobacteroides halobius (strain ATCC 35273 / DSM 5150 / MD-1) TaxID=748449 RepID=L0KDI2_HALHC|nr:DUF6470 family protein [Halobacteroides halobius]AGB42148.1 hypothetical protein Halha_2274 [Halobacteroides halobius DSM 5150]